MSMIRFFTNKPIQKITKYSYVSPVSLFRSNKCTSCTNAYTKTRNKYLYAASYNIMFLPRWNRPASCNQLNCRSQLVDYCVNVKRTYIIHT